MREANKIGYYSSSPNRQYDYDHKGDAALFLDKAFVERKLGVMRTTYEQYKELAADPWRSGCDGDLWRDSV